MKKRTRAVVAQNVANCPHGPIVSVAAEIQQIQRQREKNSRRINVIANEMSNLGNENSALERRRLELLREFDTVAR